MRAELFEIVQRDGHWLIFFAAARRKHDDDKAQVDGPRYFILDGRTWRADQRRVMKFSDVETASAYITRSVDRLLMRSTFTRGGVRRREVAV